MIWSGTISFGLIAEVLTGPASKGSASRWWTFSMAHPTAHRWGDSVINSGKIPVILGNDRAGRGDSEPAPPVPPA